MSNLYEVIGKQQVVIEQLRAEKEELFKVLKGLKDGTYSLDDINFETPAKEPVLNGTAPTGD